MEICQIHDITYVDYSAEIHCLSVIAFPSIIGLRYVIFVSDTTLNLDHIQYTDRYSTFPMLHVSMN